MHLLLDGGGNVAHGEARGAREHHHALDDVAQFPDVAGPGIGRQNVQRLGGEALDLFRVFPGQLGEIMLKQQGNIPGSLAERGQVDGHDIQPVIQILAELALVHHLFEVAVGGRDQPHIHLQRIAPSHTLEAPLLEDTQDLDLDGGINFPDLIQKQRAAIGQLEAPRPPLGGAGEGAFFMPEQLAFEQRGGQRRTVDGDEGALRARAELVDGACHQFLAGAALPLDQHGGARGRHLADHLEDFLHGRRLADDTAQAMPGVQLLVETAVFLLHGLPAQGAF